MEKRNLKQHCAIKFCIELNENATETYEKLKRVYGEHALSRAQVYRWHKAFLDGRESVENEPRSGRPCTSKIRWKCDHSEGCHEVWSTFDRMIVSWIWITKPSMTFWQRNWACGKFVQSWFQKTSPMNKRKTEGMWAWTFLNTSKMTKSFQTCHNRGWIMYFWVRSRNQTTKFGVVHEQLNAPEARMSKLKIKSMLICFFESQGVV